MPRDRSRESIKVYCEAMVLKAPPKTDPEVAPAPVSEYRLRRRVQFVEVDSAGIVHFSHFFRYFEEAEHALWREAGLMIARRGAGVVFPRVSATFDYHAPLHLEEEFDVTVRIVKLRKKSIRYACEITRGDTCIATGSMVIVCASRGPDGAMKAVDIPPAIASRFVVAT
jgi:acyl-CoA thioester hydrolase